MECIRLRARDIDFEMNQIVVRDGKEAKDRVTVLPEGVKADLKEHSQRICLGTGMTSEPYRNCSVTKMSVRP